MPIAFERALTTAMPRAFSLGFSKIDFLKNRIYFFLQAFLKQALPEQNLDNTQLQVWIL